MAAYVAPDPRRKPSKLRRLPSNARITKRPLLRPAIPSPYTSSASTKIIYISVKTPFISAVKRVRKLLDLIDKRAVGKVNLGDGRAERETLRALKEVDTETRKEPEEVILKATNRAIEKALGLGVFFQGQGDVRVRLRTGSMGTVDDIVVEEKRKCGNRTKEKVKKMAEIGGGFGAVGDDGEEYEELDATKGNTEAENEDLPETQIRKVSVLEVGISLR
ncbi:MAG: hypothetical protein Q9209_002740 [Squamulea sp. 1 TL-2023]